jgi:hypothetical protein
MISNDVRARLTAHCVMDHRSSPYNQRTNPYAERAGGVLLHMLRARLVDGCFPPKFWSVLIHGCAWTWNSLVRPNGKAPIELFERKPVDFTNTHVPGVLVYWHLDKRLRVDKRLRPSGGVGVYIGPADAVRQSGHQVYTLDGRVISTPFVIPDPAVMPFDHWLRRQLAQFSTSALGALPDDVEPSEFVLDDGVDALSLYGAEVYKKFHKGWFRGRVVNVSKDPHHPKVLLFKILYEDNNTEVITYENLLQILVNKNYSAASYSSIDPAFATFSTVHGFDFETQPAPFGDFDNMTAPDFVADAIAANAILTEISERVFSSAAASRRYKSISPEEIKAWKQYTWHHVLKRMS